MLFLTMCGNFLLLKEIYKLLILEPDPAARTHKDVFYTSLDRMSHLDTVEAVVTSSKLWRERFFQRAYYDFCCLLQERRYVYDLDQRVCPIV